MPNINIKEYDNTTASVTEYSNFTVVVPGYCGLKIDQTGTTIEYPCLKTNTEDNCIYYYKDATSTGIKVFDENGIYECSSQSEFKEKIGCSYSVKEETVKPAIAAKAAKIEEIGEGEQKVNYQTIAQTDFYGKYHGNVYTAALDTTEGHTEGYLKQNVKLDGTEETVAALHIFTKVEDGAWDSSVKYVVILPENVGNDASPAVPATVGHFGNQCAYELIGLGYKVLYKLINTGILELGTSDFWACLKDKGAYDFRYVMTGLVEQNKDANIQIADLANYKNEGRDNNGRGDCIALIEVTQALYKGKKPSVAVTSIATALSSVDYEFVNENINTFCAIVAPYVEYKLSRTKDYDNTNTYNGNRKFPAAFHYLACAARARNTNHYAEWYAVAGFDRGLSPFEVAGTGCKFGEIAVNTLAPRYRKDSSDTIIKAVNLIACIRGTYYLYGNRTAKELGIYGEKDGELKASHLLNVRELCCTLKKRIYVACRKYTFDPNSDILWVKFTGDIAPTLDKMKSNEGVKNYVFERESTDKKATMNAKVRIVPIEAVEDFDIGTYLEDSINGSNVTITEE